jgi:AcrR family transcriptional regulator
MPLAETKAERTRRRVLEAAERRFAASGFHGARLEDVAAEVGLKRAALFYHFRDKRSLHDAVLRDAFGALLARLQEVMASERPFAERAEQAARAWVDLADERPTLVPLVLRAVASPERDWRRLLPIARPFQDWMRHELRDATASGEIDPVDDDPVALLGALVGSTLPNRGTEHSAEQRRQAAAGRVRRLLAPR